MNELIDKTLADNLELAKTLAGKSAEIENLTKKFSECLKNRGKLIFFGNGGSASDSMHIAAEYASKGLSAFTLSENISTVTAIGNDSSFESVFATQLKALANSKDLAVVLSTSGESKNILAGIEQCKKSGITTVAFTGNQNNSLSKAADMCFIVPSSDTPRIQEAYLLVNHIIFQTIYENA